MKTERELFDLWFKKNFYDLHEAICCGDLVAKNYKKAMFKAWQARVPEGYVVVPLQPSNDIVVAIESKVEDQLKASAIEADPFRLDGEKIYEAIIEALEK